MPHQYPFRIEFIAKISYLLLSVLSELSELSALSMLWFLNWLFYVWRRACVKKRLKNKNKNKNKSESESESEKRGERLSGKKLSGKSPV